MRERTRSALFALVAGVIFLAMVVWSLLSAPETTVETPPAADVPSAGSLGDL